MRRFSCIAMLWLTVLSLMLTVATASASTARADVSDSADARAWLDRMSRAFKELDYQGVLIYGDNQHWETLSITHGVMGGVEYERLYHLTGESREVVRKGHDVTCIHPGEHVVRLTQNPLSQGFVNQTSAIDAYYHLSLEPGVRVAGRDTQQIIVSPRDTYRYGYRLWLDRESGLLLRSDLINQQGNVLERFQFAEISIGEPLSADQFDPQSSGHHVASHLAGHETEAVMTRQNWHLGWLPRGFMGAASQLRQSNDSQSAQGALATLMYTDGLAAITVFVDDAGEQEPMPVMSQQWGVTGAVVKYLKTDNGTYRITVVGEVPLPTVEKIAMSVMPQ